MQRVLLKLSRILVASGRGIRIYRTSGEMPSSIRRRMEATMAGRRAITFVIADREGREELRRLERGREALGESARRMRRLRTWLQALLCAAAAGAACWIALSR